MHKELKSKIELKHLKHRGMCYNLNFMKNQKQK